VNPNRTREERAVLLCLTRLAMFFNTSGHTYSGQQVAEIILTAWHSYEQSKQVKEQPALPVDVQP
jgi:hypothetical protein